MNVVTDSVNPISVTRQDWQHVAKAADTNFIEIEIVCSCLDEHQKRVESILLQISINSTTVKSVNYRMGTGDPRSTITLH